MKVIAEYKTKHTEKANSGQKLDGVMYFSKPTQSIEFGTKWWLFHIALIFVSLHFSAVRQFSSQERLKEFWWQLGEFNFIDSTELINLEDPCKRGFTWQQRLDWTAEENLVD
jgi:hypothetical protein